MRVTLIVLLFGAICSSVISHSAGLSETISLVLFVLFTLIGGLLLALVRRFKLKSARH